MKAELSEFQEILKYMQEWDMKINGLVYENMGNSDYEFQKSYRGIEFYLLKSELERQCKNTMSESLTVFVKLKNSSDYYKIIR